MLLHCLVVFCFTGGTLAHVALTYPPARKYDLDFLDNGRTKAPCGMPRGNIITSLPAAPGAMINVTWHLAYPHRGGFKLELLDQNEKYLMDLTPTTATTDYVGADDTTAQSYTVSFPESLTCKGCTLRLLRQAREWGNQYLFWSCADVDIVPVTELRTVCSGHGTINSRGQCQCEHLYSGIVCQYKDECWNDDDCGQHGRCINVDATTFPKMQCFCEIGWFGQKCTIESSLKDRDIDTSTYSKQELSNDFTLYWKIMPESEEIEAVMKLKGTSYAAIGWRPQGITSACKAFPIIQDASQKNLEPSPRHVSFQDEKNYIHSVTSKSEPEPKPDGKAEPEPEPEGKTEPEPTPEGKAKPEPEPERNAEPSPRSEIEAKSEPEPKGRAEVEGEPEPKPEHEIKAKPKPEPSGKTEPIPEPEGKAEPEPKPEGKAEPEPKPEGKAEPEPMSEGKAEPEPEPKAHAEPEPEPEGKAEPEPEPEAKAEPEPGVKAEPEPKSEGKPEPISQPEIKAESEPETKGKIEPADEGKPEPEPEPKEKVEAESKNKQKAKSRTTTVYDHTIKTELSSKPSYVEHRPEYISPLYVDPNSGVNNYDPFGYSPPNDQDFPSFPVSDIYPVLDRFRRQLVSKHEPISEPKAESEPTKINENLKPEPSPETKSEPNSDLSSEHDAKDKLHKTKSKPEPEVDSEPEPKHGHSESHTYPSKSVYTPRADFHPMDCTDIVIGMARGSLSRIADFYTRDRSTPKTDSFFGGKNDLTAALGFEVDGITTIAFRKKLKATDLTDHDITNNLMDVIWARGQEQNMYVHNPTTGLEAGQAKVKDFYRPDELKYHGHGKQRGKLTLNFYEEKNKKKQSEISDCNGLWKYPPECQEAKCEYFVKWRYLYKTDEIAFDINTIHMDRWTGIAFSKDRRMPQSDAVIGWVDHVGRPTILDVWMSDYTAPTLDQSQDIYNITGERKNQTTSLHFVRKRFTIDFDNDIHFSDTECSYFIFPVKGGTFNAISKKIGKHEATPIVSQEKVCIRKCDIEGAKAEPTSEPEPKSEPKLSSEPKSEPEAEPKSEPTGRTFGAPEPEPKSIDTKQLTSPCLGEWEWPKKCKGNKCDYKANWFYVDETDEIIFTVSSKTYNKWTGIGFSRNKKMTDTDAIIGWIEETGRSFIMDIWLESYSTPILDNQNVYNASGQRVDGMTVLQFVRKRNTGDDERDLQFSNECHYFMFPVHGGVFNAVNKKIRKHESTPIISNEKICIHSCRSKVPQNTIPTTIQTSKPPTQLPTFTTKPTRTNEVVITVKTSPLIPTVQPTITSPPSTYSVELKLLQMWNNDLKNDKSTEYRTLQNQVLQEVNSALRNVEGFQMIQFAGFQSDNGEPDDAIAMVHVLLSNQVSKVGRQINPNENANKATDLQSALNATVRTGKLGNLPIDPSYLKIVSLSAVQDTVQEREIEQESTSQGLTDEQIKIYIIIAGVLALVFLVLVQASCMIYRDRRNKRNSHTKEKLLNNSHWRDYSVTASSNYSYENFAMQEDENKISKHPVGSVSNGSALSKGSVASQPTNGLGLPRVSPPDRPLPRNSGYSATFERMAMRRSNGLANTSNPPSYATHDRSVRSMTVGTRSQQELRPDFYFMPHQRRYSGEVVKVFVDYNNPEYTGK